ncbi:MAG: CHAT domain-containing protein [Saprospiraceae bacterium]|nr:CHAT domain-containing protein [Saprospiraceae bacterium]
MYINLAIEYKNSKQYGNALTFYNKADSIFKNLNINDFMSLISLRTNKGLLYVEMGSYNDAIISIQSGIDLFANGETLSNYEELGKAYYQLGRVYFKTRNYQMALSNYELGYTCSIKVFDRGHSIPAIIYAAIIEVKGALGEFNTAEPMIDTVLAHFNYSGTSNVDLYKIENLPKLVDVLIVKGSFYRDWYNHSGSMLHLQLSNSTFIEAMEILEWHKRVIKSLKSKVVFADKYYHIYENVIRTYDLMKEREGYYKAFEVAERSRLQTLRETFLHIEALKFANVPEELINEEEKLRLEILSLEIGKHDLLSKSNETNKQWINNKIIERYSALERQEKFYQLLEKEYPEYYKAKYEKSKLEVRDIQKVLLEKQTLIQYFVGDSSIYIFVINKMDFEVFAIPNDFRMVEHIQTLLDGIILKGKDTTSHVIYAGFESFIKASEFLYSKLILPIEHKLHEALIIVPDRELGYIPFDALIKRKSHNGNITFDLEYLIAGKSICYALSSNLYYHSKIKDKEKSKFKLSCLAMAPFVSDFNLLNNSAISDFSSLAYSGKEANAFMNAIGSGLLAFDTLASTNLFFDNVQKHDIVLLSTHGKADLSYGDYSYLAFSDRVLYVRELFGINLKNDLFVLSACETALGGLHKGEGMIGLNYAFALSGVHNVCSTLWKVNDKAMFDLSSKFIQNSYNSGQSIGNKAKALQEAKLALLGNKSTSHPFYWASMVGYGNMD